MATAGTRRIIRCQGGQNVHKIEYNIVSHCEWRGFCRCVRQIMRDIRHDNILVTRQRSRSITHARGATAQGERTVLGQANVFLLCAVPPCCLPPHLLLALLCRRGSKAPLPLPSWIRLLSLARGRLPARRIAPAREQNLKPCGSRAHVDDISRMWSRNTLRLVIALTSVNRNHAENTKNILPLPLSCLDVFLLLPLESNKIRLRDKCLPFAGTNWGDSGGWPWDGDDDVLW
jgi:hypothetical protein